VRIPAPGPVQIPAPGPVRIPAPGPVVESTPEPSIKTLDFSQFKYAGSITSSAQTEVTSHTHSKSKWSEAQQATIMDVLRKHPGVSLKLLVFKLQADHEIEISEGALRKVRANGGF
jgi:hypothetical protein